MKNVLHQGYGVEPFEAFCASELYIKM